MPAQHFSVDALAAPLATVHWDFAMQAVDLTYAGTPVAHITDFDALRSTGMQGAAPDGAVLLLRAVAMPGGDRFALDRNGTALHGSDVDFVAVKAAQPTTLLDSHASVGSEAKPNKSLEKRMASGRSWLKAFGVLGLFAAFLIWVGSTVHPAGGKARGVLAVIALVVVLFSALYLALGFMAVGPRSQTLFGVGLGILALNALSNLATLARGGAGVGIGLVLSLVATYKVYDAWGAAKSAYGKAA